MTAGWIQSDKYSLTDDHKLIGAFLSAAGGCVLKPDKKNYRTQIQSAKLKGFKFLLSDFSDDVQPLTARALILVVIVIIGASLPGWSWKVIVFNYRWFS